MIKFARYKYKLRKIARSDTHGDIYGVTIPRNIYQQFQGIDLYMYVSGNKIILEQLSENGC